MEKFIMSRKKKIYGDRWEIIESLDEGGQSHVFLVRDIKCEFAEPLVLKRIKNPNRKDRFLKELKAIRRLNHNSIIKPLEFSESDDTMYLVMPYCSGGHLESRANQFHYSIELSLRIAYQIADALDHSHQNDVIHRDVKPKNILFKDANYNCCLSDFGICLIKDTERVTQSNEVVGPWAFMAPELESVGVIDVEPSVDIYSLGKIIYYMISGGVVIPRENHRLSEYNIFVNNIQLQLLGLLLDRMICEKNRRISTMIGVKQKIDQILNWEHRYKLITQLSEIVPPQRQVHSKAVPITECMICAIMSSDHV